LRLRVLGSDGGIGGSRRTTSLLVDDDVLIDAGSGVGDLTVQEMARVRKVLLTHAHLDHVSGLLLMLDSVHAEVDRRVVAYGLAGTLEALSSHVLNDEIWPDFRRIPSPADPVLTLKTMSSGDVLEDGARRFTMIEVRHVVPAVGYFVAGPTGAFAFSGDTGPCPAFWDALNGQKRLDLVLVEVSFPDRKAEMALRTGHHHPTSLARDLQRLTHRPEIWLTHLKPGLEEEIEADCQRVLAGRDVHVLRAGQEFTF